MSYLNQKKQEVQNKEDKDCLHLNHKKDLHRDRDDYKYQDNMDHIDEL